MKIYFRIFRVVLLFNYQGSRSLSDLFYTDISLSVLLTCCLRQRYISYHFCFSLSRTFFILFFEIFQKIKSRKPFRFPAFAPTRNFMLSCFVSYRFCDSDIYLTTSFRHCQELFSFNFITFKWNQITFHCAISQSRQQIKYYHTSSIMSRTFLLYANHVL